MTDLRDIMLHLLWLIPAFPLAGFIVLTLAGGRMPRRTAGCVGVGTVGLSAAMAVLTAVGFMSAPPEGHFFCQQLWEWIRVGDFAPQVAFYLDPLALLMVLVVTVVAFFIHLYSAEFMADDDGFSRFFAYMNLFVFSMLVLVLADNLLLLYLGWEGVGLCSFLLIGFWYKDAANCAAARKAFIVTRVGDTAMAVGLLLLFLHFRTLRIDDMMAAAAANWQGSPLALLAAMLLLGGAVGKSAQLPLQTWLPDAMAGPTPVSALIHAATMVTAGVYLIARTHVLFALSPIAQLVVAIIGAVTLLYAGLCALAQTDIKRVLAYSTMSQIGYMFLALGVGAYSAAMFHFMTHALFKSLLFLGAGAVILAMHHEHDMFKMGGLRKRMPVVFWTFLIGSASLAAVPLVTSGFYSKDMILLDCLVLPSQFPIGASGYSGKASEFPNHFFLQNGSTVLWAAGVLGALITAVYTFRMVFVTFFGPAKQEIIYRPGKRMTVSLVVLAALATVAGFVQTPSFVGGVHVFEDFVGPVWHGIPGGLIVPVSPLEELILAFAPASACVLGIALAWVLWLSPSGAATRETAGAGIMRLTKFAKSGMGFDRLYDRLFVRPIMWIARVNRDDIVDSIFDFVAWLARLGHRGASATQTGNLRWYAAGVGLGVIILVAIVVLT